MVEQEIYHFKVPEAEAEFKGNNLTVKLYYPARERLEEISGRLPEQLDYGIEVFERILREGRARIANQEHPLTPSAAGSLYLFNDKIIACHRRDNGAGVHKLYHSPSSGHAKSIKFTHSLRGLEETALAESAEECLLITKDENPWLIVPEDSKECTVKSAQKLGINLPIKEVKVENLPGSDKLEVYEEDRPLFSAENVCISLLYESSTSLSTLWLRQLPISSEEVIAIDSEGMYKNGRFIHFNREAYFIPFNEIKNKRFGERLHNFRVSQLDKVIEGRPFVRQPEYERPYLGPERVSMQDPHIWAPENLMVACLAGLKAEAYSGRNRLKLELEKIKARKEGRSLVPKELLASS